MKSPKERIEEFTRRYEELANELEVDFVSYPMFVPDGTPGGFRIVMRSHPVDAKGDGVKSPFIETDDKPTEEAS